MDPLVIAPIRSGMDQINTDLGYRTFQQKRAYEVRKDSNVIAGILTNIWTRRITIVLGVFAIFGVVQAFDVELTDLDKLYPLTTFVAGLANWNQVWPKVAAVLSGFVILAIMKLLSRND